MTRRYIEVTLSVEVDDRGQDISDEEFSSGFIEWLEDMETVHSDELGEDILSDLTDYFGFPVYGARSVEGVDYDDADDEGDIDEDESDDD